jgi:hypothetical protein
MPNFGIKKQHLALCKKEDFPSHQNIDEIKN